MSGEPRRASPTGTRGAWASPFAARKLHFFLDGSVYALCRAYMTVQVKPSECAAGTLAREGVVTAMRCQTCERKLGDLVEARRRG